MKLLLGTGDYRRYGLPSSRLVNRYFESAPTTSGHVALIPRPGLSLFATVDATSIIAVFFQPGTLGDLIMVVTASYIYALDASGTVVGTTPVLSLNDRVSVASGQGGVLYLTDGAQVYRCTVVQDETTITATTVPFPDQANCSSVAYLNGYFLFSRDNTHKVYFLRPGSTTIDALDFFSAEVAPDDLVSLAVLGDELWLFGQSTVEVHTPTGDPDLPFQRSIGRPTDYSLANRDTIQKIGESLAYVGADRMVYATSGVPQVISDPGVVEALRDVPLGSLRSFRFGVDGHIFYGLDIPGVGTEAYDFTSGKWSRIASYGSDSFKCLTTCRLTDGTWLAGDSQSGNVYRFDVTANEDVADPIVRVAPAIIETPRQRCSNVILDCSVGEGSDPDADPQMAMRYSDDGGKTWSDWEDADLGRTGEFDTTVVWWGLGLMSQRRLFEFRDANAVSTVIHGARINEDIR